MIRIVTTHYRYKRPPKKRANATTIEGPMIVRAKKPRPSKRIGMAGTQPTVPIEKQTPANDDRKSAIVTARKPGKRYIDVPEMTPEEHKRRGDTADVLFREMKRRIAKKR